MTNPSLSASLALGARPAVSGTASGATPFQSVHVCDFRQAGQMSRDQVRAVNILHDSFARNLTDSLGAYLRVLFEANLVSVEQLSYAEFLQRVPQTSYVGSINLTPIEASAALQIDLSLVFPLLELLLGGQVTGEIPERDLTEIEEHVLESIVRILCRELQNTWQTVIDVQFLFDRRQPLTHILQMMPPNEKILCLSLEVRMKEARGMLALVLPAAVANALLRKLAQQRHHNRRKGPLRSDGELMRRLRDGTFHVTLDLPPSPIQVRDLIGLAPGQLVAFGRPVREPAQLVVAGRPMFSAYPVQAANARAGRVVRRIETSQTVEREIR